MLNTIRADTFFTAYEQIVSAVHSSTNVREVSDLIVSKLSEILQARGAILRVLNPAKDELEFRAAFGLSEQYLSKGPLLNSKVIMELYAKNRVFIIDDIFQDPRVQNPRYLSEEGVSTILDLPVTLHENLIGIIRIFFSEERKFSQELLDFLLAVSRQCSCALETALLFEEQRTRYEQIIVQAERLSALGRMAAGIAHEINNPLTGMLLFSSRMRKEIKEDGPVKEYLDVIVREAVRCREIIQTLLEFAREKQPRRSPTSINPVLERALGLVENLFLVNRIKLHRDLRPGLPACFADANQIEQVFLNLLLNAVEAIGQDGEITVRTRLSPDSSCISVEVEDTGCGIPKEILPRIFDPFFSTKPTGHGLGLSTAYEIIKNHGGEMKVLNGTGDGTRFIMDLPVNYP